MKDVDQLAGIGILNSKRVVTINMAKAVTRRWSLHLVRGTADGGTRHWWVKPVEQDGCRQELLLEPTNSPFAARVPRGLVEFPGAGLVGNVGSSHWLVEPWGDPPGGGAYAPTTGVPLPQECGEGPWVSPVDLMPLLVVRLG